MRLRYSILSLMMTSLIGCASSSDINYASNATNRGIATNDALIKSLIATQSAQKLSLTELPARVNQLTDLVDIPELEQYLQVALSNSPSLQQSIIALKILYKQQGISSADQLPTLAAGFDVDRNQDSDDNSASADISIDWELDLWQKLADLSDASLKDISSSQASLQATKDLLTANIMRAWLEISLNQQLFDIEQCRFTILENNQLLVLERYQVGLGSLEDLDNAKTSSASTRSTLAEYQETLAQSRRSLMLLTGQWNSELADPIISSTFPEVLSPLSQLAEQNLQRRPDLQQAFYNIEAQSLRTDAAYKAMLPSFSLSASLSDIAQTPSEALFTHPVWSLLGQISAPLFQGGALKSEAEIAELTTEQTFWAYQETLLNAINEVENTAGKEYSLASQQQHLNAALNSAKRSFVSYQEKYRQGLVDIFDLLSVQQDTYDIEAQLVNITYQRLSNRIDLGLALGLGVSQ